MKLRLILRIVVVALLIGLFAWVLARLDWHELGLRFASASPSKLATMLVAWIGALLLRPLRFWFLLNVLGRTRHADYRTIWTAMVLGMAVNSFAPMRAGDVMMAVFLRHRLGVALHRSFTVIVADWLCDFVCVSAIFLCALAFAPVIAAWMNHAIMFVVISGLAGMFGLWTILRFQAQLLRLLDWCLMRLLPRHQARIRGVADEMLSGLAAVGHWKVSLPLVAVSALIWAVTAFSYWFGLTAIFADVPFAAAPFAMTSVAFSFVMPLGPGGLGAFEAAAIVALTVFGVPLEAAFAFAVIAHAAQLGSVLLFTAVAVFTQRIDYQTLWAATEKR